MEEADERKEAEFRRELVEEERELVCASAGAENGGGSYP
jgi:hypothetical protein